VGAAILTIVGGLFVMAGGALLAIVGGILASLLGHFSGLFLVGLVLGFLIVLLGILMLAVPAGHTVWGIVTVAFSIVSIPFSFAGFIVGFVLALLGGLLSIFWRPPRPSATITVSARVVPPPSG